MEGTLTRFGVGIKTAAQKLVDNVIVGKPHPQTESANRHAREAILWNLRAIGELTCQRWVGTA